jgi:hypothetical protein
MLGSCKRVKNIMKNVSSGRTRRRHQKHKRTKKKKKKKKEEKKIKKQKISRKKMFSLFFKIKK